VNLGAPSTEELVCLYLTAKSIVIERGFADEIAWQSSAALAEPTPAAFVREAAWVVLSAGMRESVVRNLFRQLSGAMYSFEPAALCRNRERARTAALTTFAHERKISAILDIAAMVSRIGPGGLHAALMDDPEPFLRSLPYIGPVTWRHLAKNLGLPIAKPDRHLTRLASATARGSVDELCDEIASWLGEPVAVVDLVLWRWSVLHAQECRRAACNPALHTAALCGQPPDTGRPTRPASSPSPVRNAPSAPGRGPRAGG
jgi:hypothetical protein